MPPFRRHIWFVLAALTAAGHAAGAEKPSFAPPQSWVVPSEIPADPAPTQSAVKILLEDQQLRLTPQSDDLYIESAVLIQHPQGLQTMGTINVAWNPDLNTLTIHKLHILRGGVVIDVLASGQTFTVLRRETNLEGAALDGTLTAAIQPGGLQVGDIVDFAYTVSDNDPVFQGISEWRITLSDNAPVSRLRLRAQWSTATPITWQPSADMTGAHETSANGITSVIYALDHAPPLSQVHDAPARYLHQRRIDFTQFASWAAMSRHFAPLYANAMVLAPGSALPAEIARIRAAASTPRDRAAAALALVQDQVRYVFLGMNDGGLIPASADLTWSRRFGDCKGKTVLLLALLHGLDIEAEPVTVKASGGDGLNTKLPLMSDFDHVLVRAHIDGRIYWLDGTRTGDRHIDDIAVPAFYWGLPLTPSGSDLVPITPQPLSKPGETEAIRIDATGGMFVPASFHVETTLHGDGETGLRMQVANLDPSRLDQALKSYWARRYSFVDIKSVAAVFDDNESAERLIMDGTAPMRIIGRDIQTHDLAIGHAPDFDRAPGPDRDAPFRVRFPFYGAVSETILLPDSGAGYTVQGQDVDRIVAGVHYKRSARIDHGMFVGEATVRTVAPEFPAADAPAAAIALRDLLQSTVTIRVPPHYTTTAQDLAALRGRTLTTAAQYIARGNLSLDQGDFDNARADYNAALTLDPQSATAIADRGLTYIWQDDEAHGQQDEDAARALDPRNPAMLRATGLLAAHTGHVQEAITAFTEALWIDPNNAFALMRRAVAYTEAGDDEHALADTATILRIKPDMLEVYSVRAGIFRRRGQADQAVDAARAVTAAAPASAAAHVVAAGIYARLHRLPDAMHEFDQALRIRPGADIYIARAQTRDAADSAGRRADIQAAAKFDLHAKSTLTDLAALQSGIGDHVTAAATLSAALAAHPKDAGLRALRGIEYAKSDRQALAGEDFSAAEQDARTGTNQAGDENNLCWFKATAGVVLDTVLQDCTAALALSPGNANYLDSQGFALLRLGRFGDAADSFTRALQIRPVTATSLYGRGLAERHLGAAKAAEIDLEAARQSNPFIDRRFADFGLAP